MGSGPNAGGDSVALSQRVLLALKETRAKLESYDRIRTEPIAIIGMACRLPGGADTPELFWDLLSRKTDAIVETPPERWDVDAYYDANPWKPGKTHVRSAGFIRGADQFDAGFFGISPREARCLDPQQRLLLEVAWEAFENSGQGPDALLGARVGVFVGIGNVDYARLMQDAALPGGADIYSTTGTVFSAAAGRISYTLGLEGPAVALDTACSSSLVAIHLACQSLRADESVMAVAGGVNLILSPATMIAMSRIPGGLSPDGRCKAFDEAADGIARAEGCGLVVLKRLSHALRDRDRIVGVIRGSAVNQDGRSAGLTVPNGRAQAALIEQALGNARVSADEVGYVETHGPGTALGDPIEAGALGAVFGRNNRERPLVIGSAKTNIGHLESAAGVAAVIKTALVLNRREIPPNLHFHRPNPHIPWERLPLQVPTAALPFPSGSYIAGVSSFGVSGTNAHVVLEDPARYTGDEPAADKLPEPGILALSAKSGEALEELIARYRRHIDRDPHFPLPDACYTAAVGRFHFPHRLAVMAASVEELRNCLEHPGHAPHVFRGEPAAHTPVCFAFSGGLELASREDIELHASWPVFRAALEECQGAEALAADLALARLWRSWGLAPAAVAGRGRGWVAAACMAGALPLAAGMELAECAGNVTRVLSRTTFQPPKIPLVSPLNGCRVTAEELAVPDFWIRAFEDDGENGLGSLSLDGEPLDSLGITGPDAWKRSRENLARLYAAGAAVQWSAVYDRRTRRRIALPTYPFQRSRYWFMEQAPGAIGIGQMLYEEQWRPQPVPAARTGPGSGAWLVLAGESDLAGRVVAGLEAAGQQCVTVNAAAMDAASPEDFARLLDRAAASAAAAVKGIIDLRIADAARTSNSAAELREAVAAAGRPVLHLVQALVRARYSAQPKLYVVTRGAVQVHESESPNLTQVPIWGLAAVLEHEHPELGAARIDLDPEDQEASAANVVAEALAPVGEKRVAYRGSQRLVARLARWNDGPPVAEATPAFSLRADATYLVTGGFGGLGCLLAEWMVDKGAQHILLIGRSAPKPELASRLERLRQSGARITLHQADVAHPAAVREALDRVDPTRPVRGTFHCPAVLDDGILMNQTWERFEKVLRPKLDGAWNLHLALRETELDFFVLFSSASALVGNPGQANYAAANAFLDGLARYRRAEGLTGLSINWGIWSSAGGVAERKLDTVINATGVGVIETAHGLAVLERLLTAQARPRQVAVMPIVWPDFLRRAPHWRFLDEFREAGGGAAGAATPFIESLGRAPAGERRARLTQHIREHVAVVLGRTGGTGQPDPRQGFFEMGMDSLTAMDLKNRLQTALGCELPSTIAFERPTVEALADYLAEHDLAALFQPPNGSAAGGHGASPETADADAPPPAEDEAAIGRRMDERLAEIEALLGR